MSRKTIGDPAFIYSPMTLGQRKRLSDAHHKRLGIPLGHRRLYGIDVPDAIYPEVSKRVHRVRRLKTALQDMRFFVRMIVVMVEEGR